VPFLQIDLHNALVHSLVYRLGVHAAIDPMK
jgi:hypothetical protein